MIVTAAQVKSILRDCQTDVRGVSQLAEADRELVIEFARRMVPVLAQAEALFWAEGGRVDMPARAALFLALHQADPSLFDFGGCGCGKYFEMLCGEDGGKNCPRLAMLARCRRIARMTGMKRPGAVARLFRWLRRAPNPSYGESA